MSDADHIYVMINPSIEGLVKIGKTTRDPDFRAKELSQATGVATPFYVAFRIEVENCHTAEEYVYAVLEYNGFKRSPNREFFEMPLRSAVKVLTLAEKELREQSEGSNPTTQSTESALEEEFDDDEEDKHPGSIILQKASVAYYGIGDELKDKKAALQLLFQAKALNFAPAYTSIADYFVFEAEPLAMNGDKLAACELREKAFDVLKEGAERGHGRCYIKMAELYRGPAFYNTHWPEQPENAIKCWKKYFRSATFINDDDKKWGWLICGLGDNDDGQSRVDYARQFLYETFDTSIPFDPEIREIILPLRAEIIEAVKQLIERISQKEQPDQSDRNVLDSQKKFLEFVERTV